ncbi:hypothetical protein Micbo1qcDRAFT_216288 [Microdochium bolleyi]|uniref:Amidohydrolase-related domain-containing protein n=1 Tax=Microdochium bolleyi TaxID=196109 RepID=A0A136IQR2_9PEZI|nr:hypothetical protein Micbo1qcDRAFT_216288 [Microdochium bolleyi]
MPSGLVITNVCLTDGISPPRPADVLIEDGRFAAFVQPGANLPRDAADTETIPGEGRYLVPGLWESHTHMMMDIDPHGSSSTADKTAAVKRGLQSYLARGVTSVVDLGCPEDLMNEVRSDIQGKQGGVFPSFYFAGPVLTGVNGWPLCMTCDHTSSWEITRDTLLEELVAGLAPKVDFIKIIYDGLPGGTDKFPHEALARGISAAHDSGRKAIVHVRSKSDLVEAVEAGADGIEHMFQPDHPDTTKEAEEAAEVMAKNGTFWCPTLATYEQIGHAGSRAYLERLCADGIITTDAEVEATSRNPFFQRDKFPRVSAEEALARLEYGLRTLRVFADKGVRIVAGSDVAIAMSRPGALLRELQLFARAGLGAAEIIRTATVNAADRLGVGAGGSVFRVGGVADVILLRKDPLGGIDALVLAEHVEMVLKAGVRV